MKRTMTWMFALALTAVAVIAIGCGGDDSDKDKTGGNGGGNGGGGQAKVVNSICPMMGNEFDPTAVPDNLIREFDGRKVGFCCAGCPEAWDKLPREAKAAKLQAVMHAGDAMHSGGMGEGDDDPDADGEPGEVVNTYCPIMGNKIDPANVPDELTRRWQGAKVGFCCAACPAEWDKLSDMQKAQKLAVAMQKQAKDAGVDVDIPDGMKMPHGTKMPDGMKVPGDSD